MTTLVRFAWGELRRSSTRAALIALVLTIQAAALGGGYLSQASLYFTRDFWAERLHLADLDIHFVPASAEEMPPLDAIARVPGVAAVDRRFVSLGYAEVEGTTPLPVVVEYLDPTRHPRVNDVERVSGSWLEPGRPEGAVVDRSFAATHGLARGAELVVNPHRFASRFTVVGVGLSPEHLVPTANPELLVPHKGSLGVIYASRESLDRTFPDELYNDIVVTFAPSADARQTTDAVLAAIARHGRLEVERVVTKKSTFGYRFIDIMLQGSRSVVPTIALIVALMAAIVAFISMHRLIAERRRELGCLLAQGFSPARIAACFLGVGLVPGLTGALLGVPGAMAFASILTKTSTAITGFPDPIMRWDARWLALAAASSIGVGLVSTLPPAYLVLRLRPSVALRGAGEVLFLGLPAFVERLLCGRPAIRYSLRNVFRRLPLTLATAVLVALAVALPAGLLTSLSSLDTWATDQARILGWDAIASFKAPLAQAHVEELVADKGVGQWDGYVQGYAPMRREDGVVEEVRVHGIPLGSDIIRFHLTAGRVFTSDEADEAILNSGFSSDRPVRLGEVVTLTRKGVTKRLRVVGLITDATLSTIILPRTTAQRFLGLEDRYSGIYLRYGTSPAKTAAPSAEPAALLSSSNAEAVEKLDIADEPATAKSAKPAFKDTKTAILDDELVTAVQVRTEFAEANERYLAAFNVVIVPFVGLSGVLAFFFLVSVLGFLFLEREAEYATLRSMGYGTGEIARIVFTEVAVLGAAGLVLSLGTWAVTAYALREPMARTWFFVPLDLRATDFFTCSLPTILFLGLAALPGIRSLLRVDLSAALRGRALG